MSELDTLHVHAPTRAEWPQHAPRVVILPVHAWDARRPPHYVLSGWEQVHGTWWSWARWLRPRSRHRDRLLAARVTFNGGGRDNELRFLVEDHHTDPSTDYGCANSFRNIPPDDPLLTTDTGKRLFSSRGVFPAVPGDVLTLMAFCDRLVERCYPLPPSSP